MPIYQFTLNNGLRIVFSSKKTDVISCQLFLRAGSRYDHPLNGTAHLLEHLLLTGTTSRSGQECFDLVESVGGSLNGKTSREYISFDVDVLRRDLDLALDLLSDLVINPLLEENSFFEQKQTVMQELLTRQLVTNHLLDNAFNLMWPQQSFGQAVTGSLESLQEIRHVHVLDFFQQHVCGSNMVLSICGDLDPDRLFENIADWFGPLQTGLPAIPAQLTQETRNRSITIKNGDQNAHLLWSWYAPSLSDPQRSAFKLLERLLGMGASGLLFQNLREMQLAYHFQAMTSNFEDSGFFGIWTRSTMGNLNQIEETLQHLLDELPDMISIDLLQKAKSNYIGTLIRQMEKCHDQAAVQGMEALLHQAESIKEAEERIDQVSLDAVREAAEDLKASTHFRVLIST